MTQLQGDGTPQAKYAGRCLGCRRWISANTSKALARSRTEARVRIVDGLSGSHT